MIYYYLIINNIVINRFFKKIKKLNLAIVLLTISISE